MLALLKDMKSLLLPLLFFSANALGYGIEDHRMITEIAIQELEACQLLPALITPKNAGDIVKFNLREDNYFLSGFKKTFEYSHFYNPIRPLKAELHRAHHADQAVLDYSAEIQKRNNVIENIGMISHMVQDASSPPHVQWINHGLADGYENKVKIKREDILALKPNCSEIQLAALNSPIEIMKTAGLATLKELEEPVHLLQLSADESQAQPVTDTWSHAFFSNREINTQKVHEFLKIFELQRPELVTPATDDVGTAGWNLKALPPGEYGAMSHGISNIILRGDNFGKSEFAVDGVKMRVQALEYQNLRKKLIRQSILSTERLLIWLGHQN